jgi:hypothetical protein
MRNGGLPPAHLPSSSLSDPSAWLQYKWLQPPPRAPDWVCDAPDNWIGHTLHEDQQAANLLPPKSPGGSMLLGACTHAERAYQDWKWVVNKLWEDKRHRLQMVAHQCHLDEETTCQCQEANHPQQLLDKRAAYKRQEAARRQWLLDEETARRQRLLDEFAACPLMAERAALAQQMATAQTIFLWLCRRCLYVRLARQTLRRQQRKAALAHLRYKQDCCLRAALAEEQRRQAAAARAKALANEADKRHRQDALAAEQRCRESAERAAATAESALAKEERCQESDECAVATAESALVEEGHRQESVECAAATVEKALAAEQRCQELAKCAAATVEKALAAKQRCQESAECAAASAESAMAKEQRRRELADCAAVSAESTLTDEHRPREVAEHGTAMAELVLADE